MLSNRNLFRLKAYQEESSGNVAIIAALATIPILSVMGLAIDWQLLANKKSLAQTSLDSTLISAALDRRNGVPIEEAQQNAIQSFDALSKTNDPNIQCGSLNLVFDSTKDEISGSVNCTQPTTLSSIFGREEVSFSIESGAAYGVNAVDVAFVFDLSTSMNFGGRLPALKNSATEAVDILLSSDENTANTRIAISTYTHGINAGPFFDQVVDFIPRDGQVLNSETVGNEYDELVGRVLFERGRRNNRRFWNYETTNMVDDFSARAFYSPRCVYQRRGPLAYTDDAPVSLSRNPAHNDTFLTVGHPIWNYGSNTGETRQEFRAKARGEDRVHQQNRFVRLASQYTPRHSTLSQTGNRQRNNVVPSEQTLGRGALITGSRFRGGITAGLDTHLENCRDDSEPVPLTDDADALKTFIRDMEAGGGTAGHLGIAWGWYMLSPKWRNIWPSESRPLEYDAPETTKALVIMTDGAFNTAHPLDPETSTEMAAAYCDNIKRDTNISIFTIAFNVPPNTESVAATGQSILDYCATNDNFAFSAENPEELTRVYQEIAATISDLRISQ